MSYFDDASLVMIPSGYKTSKVYSVKPTDGSGDLTFSRSNDTATRVNSAGLIEKVRTNIYPYGSNILTSHFPTSSGGATLTQGQTDPDGGTTAMRVQFASGATNFTYFAYATTPNLPLTRSVYIKGASAQTIQFADPSGTGGKNINITTSWARYDLAVAASGAGTYGVYFQNISDAAADFTIAFIQIETGDIATDYIATTSAAVSVGPVANVPRLDYLNSSCPRLLLEPQRTNLLTYSEQFDNAAWTKVQSSITANNGVSPDGYANADKLIANTTSNIHFANIAIADTAASWTYSIFAKAAGYDRLIMWTAATNFVGFNLTTGVVESTLGTGVTSANIQNYGNGWYRCSITSTSVSSGTSVALAVFNAAYPNGNVNPIFTGNGTDGILVYGAQFEAGAYATSYIPTLGAAVTRGADAMNLAALNNADMTFTAFLELDEPSIGSTAADWFNIRNAAALGRAFGYGNVFGFADAYSTSALSKTKMLWKQESGTTAKIFGDGALLGTSTTGTYSTPFTILEFYGAFLLKPVRIKQFIFFANNITDAQCIELTTL